MKAIKLGLRDITLLLLFFTTLSLHLNHFADDPGLGWHLVNGISILKNFSVPNTDSFLHSAQARPWVSDQWLSDVLFAAVHTVGGWPLLYAALLILFMYSFWILLFDHIAKECTSHVTTIIAILLAFKLSEIHFIARPTLLSLFFFVILLRMLANSRESHPRFPLGIFFLFLVWSNSHPAFVNGLVLLAIDSSVRILLQPASWKAAIYSLAVALIATLINPWGFRLHQSIVYLASSSYFLSLNTEWSPLQLNSFEGSLFILVALLSFIAFVFNPKGWTRERGSVFIAVLFFAVLSLQHIRVLPYFAIVSAAACARGILAVAGLCKASVFNLTRRILERIELYETNSTKGRAALYLGAIGITFSALYAAKLPFYAGDFGPSGKVYPYAALESLVKESNIRDERVVILSSPNWGGFITWYAYSQGANDRIKAVIDDRNTLLGEDFYRDFFQAMTAKEELLVAISRYSATHLLLSRGSPIADFVSNKLSLESIHMDSQAVLYKLPTQISP